MFKIQLSRDESGAIYTRPVTAQRIATSTRGGQRIVTDRIFKTAEQAAKVVARDYAGRGEVVAAD